jgi:organic radical activating enzyme
MSHGEPDGFRIEDLLEIDAFLADDLVAAAEPWLRRRLTGEPKIGLHRDSGPVRMRALFARRGILPTSQRKAYTRDGGRVRVEAFELHVVEHCNLRCAHCCNMSPYLAEHTLSVAAIDEMCRLMASHLQVDVFKIMGGEPLLHPDIAGALAAIRRSGISKTVRLFTNGLLLHAMKDDFWAALDELTISNYASAPVKPALLEAAREKARAFDVVLNVKAVSEFSEVMRARREPVDAEVQRTYDACWLRHRCLVVRRGRFFMCTRAAYADEFHRALLHSEHPEDRDRALHADGVPLSDPDFANALLAYMNRSEPLASCRFCYGGAGPVADHVQLTKSDVREGRLHSLKVVRS